jgi:hypothetical protein
MGFHKVLEVKPEAVKLQVRSKLLLIPEPDGSFPPWLDRERREEIYRPQTKTLSVKKGVPVLE